MTHGLVLLHDGLMALRILLLDLRLAAIVQQELGKVEIFLLARSQIETGHGHLGNLVTRHHTSLTGVRTYLLASHVGIATGNVEKLGAACSLPMRHGAFNHVAEVIELVAQVFLLHPTLVASPVVRVGRVLRTGGIEVAVGLLCRRDDVDDRVAVGLQLLVRIGLQDIGGTLDGLVGVGIVEGIAHAVDLEHLRGVLQVLGGILEVLVAPLALALRESQGDGHVATGLKALSPERAGRHLHCRERHGRDGIARLCRTP